MLIIELTYLKSFSGLLDDYSNKKAILYADFNVINYLYEINFKPNKPNIIFYPDSTAVFSIIRFINKLKLKKLVSTDLLDQLLQTAIKSNKRIFFFGNSNKVLSTMIEKLEGLYSNINVCGYYNGYNYDDNEVIEMINKSEAELLFVGLGVGRQEKWIIDNFEKLNCKLILSCGGWFNFLSGMNKRAPLWIRKIHLEWMYKLVTQFPRVWKRYTFGLTDFFSRILSNKINLVVK